MNPRICVITGASRGIGLATALRFAGAGYSVVASARGETELRSAAAQVVKSGAACEPIVADVGTPDGAQRLIDAAVRRFGRIDVLINNAGVAPLAKIDEMSNDSFQATLAINVGAVFYATRAVWPLMCKQASGIIVNVSSVASINPFPGFSVYGACKAWVNTFTRASAEEGRALGIRVYGIAPGAVETNMLRQHFPDFPAAQVLAPDEVAAAIESVCDERLHYATGQTIFVRR